MKIQKTPLILLLIVVLQSGIIFTANAQMTKIPNGILVKAQGQQIELLAIKGAAFCLGLNNASPATIKSVFIDESSKVNTPFTVITAPPFYGLKTSYGKLTVNIDTKTWCLYDAAGQALIRDGVLSATDTSVQISYTADGLLYGSGNKSSKELEKK